MERSLGDKNMMSLSSFSLLFLRVCSFEILLEFLNEFRIAYFSFASDLVTTTFSRVSCSLRIFAARLLLLFNHAGHEFIATATVKLLSDDLDQTGEPLAENFTLLLLPLSFLSLLDARFELCHLTIELLSFFCVLSHVLVFSLIFF